MVTTDISEYHRQRVLLLVISYLLGLQDYIVESEDK